MNSKVSINVVGGSASTAYALSDPSLAWPELVRSELGVEINHATRGGLTLVRSIDLIDDLPPADVLVLHFGTSVAWPSPVVRIGMRLGMEMHNETLFHQPPYPYGGGVAIRIRKNLRLRLRNAIKYFLFFIGAYRPKISVREIEDQVRTVLTISKKNALRVIWIQHRSLQSMRLIVERFVYQRYYRRLVRAINANLRAGVEFIELEPSFMVPANYLLDGVHLSEKGHAEIARIVVESLETV